MAWNRKNPSKASEMSQVERTKTDMSQKEEIEPDWQIVDSTEWTMPGQFHCQTKNDNWRREGGLVSCIDLGRARIPPAPQSLWLLKVSSPNHIHQNHHATSADINTRSLTMSRLPLRSRHLDDICILQSRKAVCAVFVSLDRTSLWFDVCTDSSD